jgi:glutamate 5-kinase
MRRVVLKVGSSSLTHADGSIDVRQFTSLASAASYARTHCQIELAIVSSGAVAAGAGALARPRPRNLPEKQAYAALGQVQLMQHWAQACAPQPVAQFLLTAGDIHNRRRFINAKQAFDAAFKLGMLPIINENDTVATEELKLGDNDTLSAWVAYLVGAQALLLITDVDGLYTANPRTDPNATRIPVVSDIASVLNVAGSAGSARGTGGMQTKLRAAQIATEAGIETIVLNGGGEGVLRWLQGADLGTRFLARGNPRSAKRAWILHQPARGKVVIDAGAVSALSAGKSLLPSGVVQVIGDFDAEDAIQVMSNQTKQVIAQGLTQFDATTLRRVAGKRSAEIESLLGSNDFDEVIHRDQLVLLDANPKESNG